jgi:cation:H+ antiporter
MLETWLPLSAGLALLIAGGEVLVRGAVQVADRLGVSPLVIGLTLVGFGTSTPELVTSVQAARVGSPGIAFGNIVGSNIANILLIVGTAAILCPILVTSAALRRDGIVMLVVAVVFAVLAAVIPMTRLVGAIFVAGLAIYVYMAFRHERRASTGNHGAIYEKSVALQSADPGTAPAAAPTSSALIPLLVAFGGLALVVIGGYFLVEGAVALAQSYGISESVIGLTIVAVGTSMPEFVTSTVAALKRLGDVAFGNIVGSNIYNVLGIGGVTALIAPGAIPAEIVSFHNLVMIGVSVLLLAVAWTGLRIARLEGAILLAGYCGYVFVLWP